MRNYLNIIIIAIAAAVILTLFFCHKNRQHLTRDKKTEKLTFEATQFNEHAIDSAVSLLRTGYLVLRMGRGADSYLLSQFNSKDKTYSHCGIVVVEGGYPFVYHAIGGEDNPDERLRRDSAKFYFSQQHNSRLAIVKYDYDNLTIRKLVDIVHTYYRKAPKFDMKFDLKTDDKLYCAEFVYKSINKAAGDADYISKTTLFGVTFVGIDNLFLNSHAGFIWQVIYK